MTQTFYQRLHACISASHSPAYRYFEQEYSYAQMYAVMKKINAHLNGCTQKKIVIYGDKEFEVYAAIYSVILSNNIWVPITPGYPWPRLQGMMELLEPDMVLYNTPLPEEFRAYAESHSVALKNINEMAAGEAEAPFTKFDFRKNDSAYIMFTSGSTGVPKGVPMTHENYINFIDNALKIIPFRKGEVFSDYHDFAFDISIFYLFCAPLTGSALSPIKKDEERIFPVAHFQKNKVTVWSSVPSVIARIQKLRPAEVIQNDFHISFICGEPFRLDVLRYCLENLRCEKVYNFYGLTETGVENFYHECSPADLARFDEKGFVPIGQPLLGNEIRLNADGELLISGCQLTPMYLAGREAHRFEVIDGTRWYHTGDIVEKYKGEYFCKGRVDSQVKLSGYRIELMDIEVQVRHFPGVKEAVCLVDDSQSAKLLVCVCEKAADAVIESKAIKAALAKHLPEYMVPKKFFFVQDMPRNTNGKLDRKRIREMYFQGALT
ncbi:MAG TPA: AMP-binding protein [Candidatus Omnitrophota bacterium]|nr:AMP-binding protein [Candidatus Omnitrophota bacterium]HRZ15281.1 AMP-binding protein [Candidatus Omnitrophota bacterium]